MFHTTLTNLIVLYPLLLLGVVVVLWAGFEWRRHRREGRLTERVLRCRICGEAFEDESDEELARCPHCESLNERETVRPI